MFFKLHLLWLENETYSQITRPWYTKATPFPLKFWLPGTIHSKAEKRVYVAQGTENLAEADIDSKASVFSLFIKIRLYKWNMAVRMRWILSIREMFEHRSCSLLCVMYFMILKRQSVQVDFARLEINKYSLNLIQLDSNYSRT